MYPTRKESGTGGVFGFPDAAIRVGCKGQKGGICVRFGLEVSDDTGILSGSDSGVRKISICTLVPGPAGVSQGPCSSSNSLAAKMGIRYDPLFMRTVYLPSRKTRGVNLRPCMRTV